VALGTGKIAGFESLIRWYHPVRGFVSPAVFIPVAEESGLIGAIGEWVLLESCRQLKQWQTEFPEFSRLKISVNLSSRQLTPRLCDRIDWILAQADLPGKYLKLEITETAIMEDPESAIAIFHELKKRKIQLSIDDFGTGYCSLAYLHRFPVDTLKVDRSFVQKMSQWGENAEIVHTIIALAHSLGMETIAEGIETMAQMQQLRGLNCTCGQGYFFSKPLDAESATRLLKEKKRFSTSSNLHAL
jgi:EAL domain-containing protein (putative c-di-GMP-specific phosphodiesterase class I)